MLFAGPKSQFLKCSVKASRANKLLLPAAVLIVILVAVFYPSDAIALSWMRIGKLRHLSLRRRLVWPWAMDYGRRMNHLGSSHSSVLVNKMPETHFLNLSSFESAA